MKSILLNLYQGNFPMHLEDKFLDLSSLETLGVIKDQLYFKLTIEKLSKDLFLAKGIILVTLEADCQTCFKKTLIKLDLETHVGIKDIKFENLDVRGALEIHYQDVERFNIKNLVYEEIYLNFPSTVTCCNIESNGESKKKNLKKTKPFQKIRDLIK
tara:strand:- start:1503 stop:1973 length:471 start_codon:yes stop_codon:yes gene_type:complete